MKFKILIGLSIMFGPYAFAEETEASRALIDQQTRALRIANDAAERTAKSGAATAATSAECEGFKTKIKIDINYEGLTVNDKNQLKDGDTGTNTMRECVSLSKGHMRHLYKNGKSTSSTAMWDQLVKAKCIEDSKVCGKTEMDACVKKLTPTAVRCDAVAFVLSVTGRDWENADHVVQEKVTGGNPAITCKGQGVATLDYEGCVKFVQNGDIMEAAQTAVHKGQELYYADKTMSAQAEVSKSDNTATAALEALKTGVKSQKEMMQQRTALDTGKLAVLANYYMDMPTKEDVQANCTNYQVPSSLAGGDKELCKSIVTQNDFGILMNQQAKEKMKAKLIKVGIDVGSDAVMAGLLAKREGDLNNAIAKIDSFKPIDPLAPQPTDLQTTFCQQNPGDPKCLGGGLERTFDLTNDNVISFGEGGTGAMLNPTNPYADTTNSVAGGSGGGGGKGITPIGSAITASHQGGGLANTIAAGTITKGGAPAGGGGGGGGAGGGASGGGGGGAPAGQGNPGGVSAALGGKPPAYNGGSGFSLLGGGNGLRNNKAKGEKEENPFGKLFGKNGNSQNGTINFRGLASQNVGSKGDNIFDMISKRYTTVNGEKRLIEYEAAK